MNEPAGTLITFPHSLFNRERWGVMRADFDKPAVLL